MAIEKLSIGGAPCDEECAQTGITNDAARLNRLECRAFMVALERKLGAIPEGCELFIKSNPHDFGTYYEVWARYEANDQAAADYAFRCEGEGPATWQEVGMWPPVKYDGRGQPVHIIEDPRAWIIADNTACRNRLMDGSDQPEPLTGPGTRHRDFSVPA